MVANLDQLGISVHCQVSVRSQYLVRLLSLVLDYGGHTIHPPIEGLLPPTGIEPTSFRNLASKVAGLQVHATTFGLYKLNKSKSGLSMNGMQLHLHTPTHVSIYLGMLLLHGKSCRINMAV